MIRTTLAVLAACLVVMASEQQRSRLRFIPAPSTPAETFYTGTVRSVTCSGTITTALQNAVNASSDLDVVSIGAGTCSTGRISWSNKNIKIMGAADTPSGRGPGTQNTHLGCSAGCFQITVSNITKAKFRITGLRMNGSTSSANIIFINAENTTAISSGWRIDNNHWDYTGVVSGDPFIIWGYSVGLVDHNYFDLPTQPTMILFSFFQTALGEFTWGSPAVQNVGGWFNLSQPSQYGNHDAAVYFEDNLWEGSASGGTHACFDASAGGARVVIRYNTMTNCYVYNHWVRANDLDVFQWELYNNTFVDTGDLSTFFRSESGTGVMFNNTITGGFASAGFQVDDRRGAEVSSDPGQFGACDGSRAWDGNAGDPSAPGWPCLAQIGQGFGKTYAQITSGDKLPYLPAYAWNNGTQAGCATGGACTNSVNITEVFGGRGSLYVKGTAHPNGERDFVNNGTTPMPGYSATTYPHPSQTARN